MCRDGVHEVAIDAIKSVKANGFRVTTNTTRSLGANPERVRAIFDELTRLGVERMMASPDYRYEKVTDDVSFAERHAII